ncbi:MAG TPA: hypothetical protein PK431_13955 [Chitinophagales bacterium]|nr:hypothetical protein [Chitinophagales bacterium]
MIDFTEENKESLIWHFASCADRCLIKYGKEVSFCELKKIVDEYVGNEISMQKGMQEYYDYLKEENRKNHRLLNAIKKVKGKTFFKYLMGIIEDSEGIKGLAQIVKEPVGKFQEEKYGRQINGIWVEQWSVGMEGDSYEGFVCVKVKPNKYLKFGYSM